MPNARRNRLVVRGVLVASAFLCYGLVAERSASGATKPRKETASQRPPLLYVAQQQTYEVLVYDENARHGLPIRKITNGVVLSNGVAVDASENLYVANTNNSVTVYPRGKESPSKTYYWGLTSPSCIAVGGDGTLYVCNTVPVGSQPAGVVVYPPGRMRPSKVLSYAPFTYVTGVAVDAAGNVYLSGSGSTSGVIEFPAGSLVAKPLGLPVTYPSGLAVAGDGALVVSDYSGHSGEVKVFPPGTTVPSHIFGRTGSPALIAFSTDGTVLFVADGDTNVVEGYRYPRGGLIKIFAGGMLGPIAVAASPPAPLGPPFSR